MGHRQFNSIIKEMKKLCLALLITILFISCKSIKEPQYTGIKGFKVNKIDLKGIDATIDLGIKNPNDYGFSIYKSSFEVKVGGKVLGNAKSTKRVFIKRNEEKIYSFQLKSSFEGLELGDIIKLVGGGAKGNMELKGKLMVGRFYIKKGFPINLSERIKL